MAYDKYFCGEDQGKIPVFPSLHQVSNSHASALPFPESPPGVLLASCHSPDTYTERKYPELNKCFRQLSVQMQLERCTLTQLVQYEKSEVLFILNYNVAFESHISFKVITFNKRFTCTSNTIISYYRLY